MRSGHAWKVLVIGLLISSPVAYAGDICFTDQDAQRLVVDLERGRNYQEQIELYRQANSELERQVGYLKEVVALQKEQLLLSRDAVKQYQELIDYQRKSYEHALQEKKPDLLKKLIDSLGLIGIGVLFGLVL
ncbi:MAG: hypothetical protein K8I29_08470 [Alphaproteobacteria bacterium]|uniref:Uncharacterized protein n=1 Tax=Candidatus Nitrobium versatile TaxID=2884831 RepID=A0A953LWS1_9BACT|nr:hypothetical protein [Candidatus Nitrobium versatile]